MPLESKWASAPSLVEPETTAKPRRPSPEKKPGGLVASRWANATGSDDGQLKLHQNAKKNNEKHTRKQASSQKQRNANTKPNPLAARLGITDASIPSSESDDDSEELSRPSTNARNKIFDSKAKVSRESHHANTSQSSNHRDRKGPSDGARALAARLGISLDGEPKESKKLNSKPTESKRSKATKAELLKKKIEEQRGILQQTRHKEEQSQLLEDFLNDDNIFEWDEQELIEQFEKSAGKR